MKNLTVVLLAILLTACVTSPQIDYDPNEQILFGVVLSKEVLDDPHKLERAERELSAERSQFVVQQANAIGAGPGETIVAIIVLNMLGLEPPGYTLPGDPVAYIVQTESNQRYKVISNHLGFSPGDCVKLFISENTETYPPRMAYGGECSKDA